MIGSNGEPASVWHTLSEINVNENTEKKGKFTYLSWAWAWSTLKKHYPLASFEKHYFEGLPYALSPNGFAFVRVTVTVEGESITETLPVLNGANNPIKDPNSFEINTALQRCLAKTIAMHGLGAYIYAGEDLPEGPDEVEEFAKLFVAAIDGDDFLFVGRAMSDKSLHEILQKVNNKTPRSGGYVTSQQKAKQSELVDRYIGQIEEWANQFDEAVANDDQTGSAEILESFVSDDKEQQRLLDIDKRIFFDRINAESKQFIQQTRKAA